MITTAEPTTFCAKKPRFCWGTFVGVSFTSSSHLSKRRCWPLILHVVPQCRWRRGREGRTLLSSSFSSFFKRFSFLPASKRPHWCWGNYSTAGKGEAVEVCGARCGWRLTWAASAVRYCVLAGHQLHLCCFSIQLCTGGQSRWEPRKGQIGLGWGGSPPSSFLPPPFPHRSVLLLTYFVASQRDQS